MKKAKYLILGGGPAGLTLANRLIQSGEKSVLLLEKESTAGGLCRSAIIDNSPLDIGGGHFLDVKIPEVLNFLFKFMPETEWTKYERDSKIVLGQNTINHPIEANIWQMKTEDQILYLKSIAIAGCNLGTPMPLKFVDWISWKLGDKIAREYMIPYNQKVFSKELDQLGTYWLEKLPNVSFDETLLSCLNKKPYGTQPGHAQFYYPKNYGYGELWLRMAENIRHHIEYNIDIKHLELEKRIINKEYTADVIINTIPWTEYEEIVGLPESIKNSINELKYSSIQVDYYNNNLKTKAHWIYYPNPDLSYHRILVRHNFCQDSKGYWTETNKERVNINENKNAYKHMNKYAYPLNTLMKPQIMASLISWMEKYNVYACGRWGEWSHFNSDITVNRALSLANKFL